MAKTYVEHEFIFNDDVYVALSDGTLWRYFDGNWVLIEKTKRE